MPSKDDNDTGAMPQMLIWAMACGESDGIWAKLCLSEKPIAAQAFKRLVEASGPGVWADLERRGASERFADLAPVLRVVCCGLCSVRLREMLFGNLNSDDSGLSPVYEGERRALRMLCLLRIFKESRLSTANPDPRINSLARIELAGWRDRPGSAAPGLVAEQASQLRSLPSAALLTKESLARVPFLGQAFAVSSALAAAAAAAGAALSSGASGHWAIASGVLAFLILASPWSRRFMMRYFCKRRCEKLLSACSFPPSRHFESEALAAREAIGRLDHAGIKEANAARHSEAVKSLEGRTRELAEQELAVLADAAMAAGDVGSRRMASRL